MNNLKILAFIWLGLLMACDNSNTHRFTIEVKNPTSEVRKNEPIEINLSELHLTGNEPSIVFKLTLDGKAIPFQVDKYSDTDTLGQLAFLCNLLPNESLLFDLEFTPRANAEQISFEDKTWAQLMLKENMVLQKSLSKDGGDLYKACFHHGPAFENNEIAYRVYFDKRMSIDVYGKKQNVMELRQTNWYSDSIQRKNNFGKDILWVGKTISVGAVRGWNGTKATYINPVGTRTASILAYGPIRTVVKMESTDWDINQKKVNIASVFTLYAGHHEFRHQLKISADSIPLCTGLMKKEGAIYYHEKGIEGLWGYNIAENTDAVADTFGLGVIVPEQYIVEKASDELNYLEILNSDAYQSFEWYGLAVWNQEENGINNENQFFSYLKELKFRIDNPVQVSFKKI